MDQYPVISERDFTGGSAATTTSGAFIFVDTAALHLPAAFADDTETTLTYGEYPTGDGILLGFSRLDGSEGISVNVQWGDWLAVYMGTGCAWEVAVTDVSVSGHISCNDIPAWNDANEETGPIDLELDFSADSVPVPDESDG